MGDDRDRQRDFVLRQGMGDRARLRWLDQKLVEMQQRAETAEAQLAEARAEVKRWKAAAEAREAERNEAERDAEAQRNGCRYWESIQSENTRLRDEVKRLRALAAHERGGDGGE